MSGDVHLDLWLHEYKMDALSSVLAEQGATVEERMNDMLLRLYEEQVPSEIQQRVRASIQAEYTLWEEGTTALELEQAEDPHTAFHVRENGADRFFVLERSENLLCVANMLRGFYENRSRAPALTEVPKLFYSSKPIGAELYERMLAIHMAAPNKVTAVFDLDFDKQELSTIDPAHGWRSYSIRDIFIAVNQTYQSDGKKLGRSIDRFMSSLEGRQRPSAGRLSASEIFFAEEIAVADGLLNFYMETSFDVGEVFGALVCANENDDALNVCANYDMASGLVCDELEVNLYRADGRGESVTYRLNTVEKAIMLRKMDAYCQGQTGKTLKDYSAQLMTKEMTPPTQLMM